MKCKRCLAQVPDDVDICPNCGQDLTALRQLLKNFYAEEPGPSGDLGPRPSLSEETLHPAQKEGPTRKEPRVVFDSEEAQNDPGFSLPRELSTEEAIEEEEPPLLWEGPRMGGFWLRSMAFAIDHLILLFTLAIFTVVGFLAAEIGSAGARDFFFYQQARIVLPVLLPLAVILFIAYFAFFHGAWGQTIGKMIFGLRVVTVDGQPPSFSRALARTVVYGLSAVPLFLGFLWVGFTSSKRAWHDWIAGTMVIRE